MKRLKQNSGLWQYLKEQGLLDTSGEERKDATKAYRKLYLQNYKKEHKEITLQYGIAFKRDEAELINKAASKHRMKPSTYIRNATLAYTNQSFLLITPEAIYEILQLLRRYQTVIEDRERKVEKSWFGADRKYKELAEAVKEMRHQMEEAMLKPTLLLEAIKMAIANNPNFKAELNAILHQS
ncbi:MAG: hypothetical protein JST76_02445 [Bacteroidetes bacterium]|nr:hypothetical protein [Bacteroidota bacterium]